MKPGKKGKSPEIVERVASQDDNGASGGRCNRSHSLNKYYHIEQHEVNIDSINALSPRPSRAARLGQSNINNLHRSRYQLWSLLDNRKGVQQMTTYKIENYTFEIVEKIPEGYEVWNIGRHMQSDELVPLCQVFAGTYNINPDTLKAIKMLPAEAAVKACRKYLKRKTIKANRKIAAEKALAILEKYI